MERERTTDTTDWSDSLAMAVEKRRVTATRIGTLYERIETEQKCLADLNDVIRTMEYEQKNRKNSQRGCVTV